MKHAEVRPYSDPATAARKLVELAALAGIDQVLAFGTAGFPAPNAPGSRSNCGLERRECRGREVSIKSAPEHGVRT